MRKVLPCMSCNSGAREEPEVRPSGSYIDFHLFLLYFYYYYFFLLSFIFPYNFSMAIPHTITVTYCSSKHDFRLTDVNLLWISGKKLAGRSDRHDNDSERTYKVIRSQKNWIFLRLARYIQPNRHLWSTHSIPCFVKVNQLTIPFSFLLWFFFSSFVQVLCRKTNVIIAHDFSHKMFTGEKCDVFFDFSWTKSGLCKWGV